MVHLFIYHLLVPCPALTAPNDGGINCILGSDGVPSYEDTCSFTCNIGYELTGSIIRNCQSGRNWSSTTTMCLRGMLYYYNYVQLVDFNVLITTMFALGVCSSVCSTCYS